MTAQAKPTHTADWELGRWWLLPSTTRAGEEEQAGGGGGGSAETVCQRPLTWVRAVTLFPMSGSMGGSSPT